MTEQTSSIYRKKTLDRISSPEQLTDYPRVTTVGIWAVLAAAVLLIAGIAVWSFSGRIETVVTGTAEVKSSVAEIYLNDSSMSVMAAGQTVRFGSKKFMINDVMFDENGIQCAFSTAMVKDGVYEVQVVLRSLKPIDCLFNWG
ncbi:MAG: hypothetical protein J6N15_10730 [Ruminiclostridium sp.]|nr:hypothetical protein [Ruminiclostridium sp.]